MGRLITQLDALRAQLWVPPGHYYSPIPAVDAVRRRESHVFDVTRSLPGIDLRAEAQRAWLERLATPYADQPFADAPVPGLRYHFDNPYFGHFDALVWHGLLRVLRPKRVIEVGSGYSTAVLLDTNERFLDRSVEMTFIEPYPERLYTLMQPEDHAGARVLVSNLQDVPLETFDALDDGDVLFIDSAHVSKTDSDVNHALFEILPRLARGVHVHFHDVFDAFEYPKTWVYEGRAWNEAYVLRAFLQYNPEFEITLWNSNVERTERTWIAEHMPLLLRSGSAMAASGVPTSAQSIWLRRT